MAREDDDGGRWRVIPIQREKGIKREKVRERGG